jgi:ribose 1,5-bisphosphokinase
MGPSGAGKDSVMGEAAALMPGRLVLAERLVTRPPSALSADRFVTEEHLDRLAREGRLALGWRAHGYGYAIERTVEDDIRRGLAVMVNGSRGYLPQALALCPSIVPVLVTADPGMLRERLEKRAREGAVSIGERLLRTDASFGLDRYGLAAIDNSGYLETAVESFLTLIRDLLEQADRGISPGSAPASGLRQAP